MFDVLLIIELNFIKDPCITGFLDKVRHGEGHIS